MSEATMGRSANALLFGAALGLAVGMLVAPKSGRENRERLAQEYQKTRDHVQKGAQSMSEKVKSTAKRAKNDAESVASDSGQDYPSPVM